MPNPSLISYGLDISWNLYIYIYIYKFYFFTLYYCKKIDRYFYLKIIMS